MNNAIMRTVDVTTEWAALSSGSMRFSGTISALPANAAAVEFRSRTDADGESVNWIAGEYHDFNGVDLATIQIKGQAGDKVTLVGGTW